MSEAERQVWEELGKIQDPEIPVLSLVEMKVIRNIRIGERLTVVFSPTYVGCPATGAMIQEIRLRMTGLGYRDVEIETTFSPPWSTDLLDEAVREKLRLFGIAPPPHGAANLEVALGREVHCPHCGSEATTLESSFGPTLCRQIFYCNGCRQSFERFKPL
jgi:ring-1,2-phenylacetyl-CoA epoxidase subunit PaaD